MRLYMRFCFEKYITYLNKLKLLIYLSLLLPFTIFVSYQQIR